MTRYLTPLPGMLAGAVEQALNRAIALDDGARSRLRPLVGKSVLLQLAGLGIDLHFDIRDRAVGVSAESKEPPATAISGTPVALLAMAVPDWRASGSGVRIEGDAGAAQAFEKLIKHLDPDWEAMLVERLGPVAGHRAWRVLLDARDHGRRVAATAADQAGRYLREESGLLVTRGEVDAFVEAVDELREDVDRLEARLRRRGRT